LEKRSISSAITSEQLVWQAIDSGALVIMREFYKQYWSKALNC
jgi:hypothetical protein